MKKLIIIIIHLFVVYNINSKNTIKDLKTFNAELRSDIDYLKNELLIRDSIFKKQQLEIIHYKVKEDYYAIALSEQATRFALIITGLLAFVSLASYSWLRFEKKRIYKKLNKFRAEFNQLKKDHNQLESDIRATTANSYILISNLYKNDNKMVNSFIYMIKAVNYGIKSKNSKSDNNSEPEIGNLKIALHILEQITHNKSQKDKLFKKVDEIKELIESIHGIGNCDVKDLCSQLRTLLIDCS